jgi:RNA polymerase sigma factor (sigma-70 family)
MDDGNTEVLWENLRVEFLDAVRNPNRSRDVWQIFANSEFYREQLSTCAKISLMETGAPKSWADDIVQEAMVLLARQLRKRSDLGYQLDRPTKQFASWIRTILFRQCHEAIRSYRRKHGRDLPLNLASVSQPPEVIEQKLDLRAALNSLDELPRTVMFMSYNDLSLREIADCLQITYDKVRNARKQGRATLRLRLQSYFEID